MDLKEDRWVTDLANAILCMDAEGRIVYANEVGCRWLHCRPEQASVLSFSALPVRAKTSWQQLWLQLQTCGSCTLEMESPANTAEMSTAHWTLHYVRFLEKEYAIAFLRDLVLRPLI